jgi:hypothetical protein
LPAAPSDMPEPVTCNESAGGRVLAGAGEGPAAP